MDVEDTDIAIIGAGIAGAAVARSLARRGAAVTLLERTQPANHEGSSHGSARIFRYAYPDDAYTRLVVRAEAVWRDLATEAGAALIAPTGALDHGERRDPAGLAAVLERCGVEHELLSATAAEERWPQLRFATEVLHHPGAGVIDAERAVQTMVRTAGAHGAAVATNWDVSAVERTASGFALRSAAGETLAARRIVVAAGGWLPALLERLPLRADLRRALPAFEVRQEQAHHFRYRDDAPATGPWPTFIHKTADLEVYGLPGGRDAAFAGQKVAQYNGGPRLRSALEQTGLIDPANRERVVGYVGEHMPGLDPAPYAETTCLFTNTPTEDFVVDGVDGIAILSACSGHGAKFGPLLGELVAASLIDGVEPPARFRLGLDAAVPA